jgi:DNA-binding HxlR family transcriptional regulator
MSDNELTSSFEVIRRISGDKWKFLIICYLFNGHKRFGELQYHIDSITKKVLTENLRELEDMAIIKRKVYPVNTYHVEYSLTKIGYTLQPIFQSLIIWSLSYSNEYRQRLEQESKTE